MNQEIDDSRIEVMKADLRAKGGELLDFRDEPEDFDDLPESF
jgi:hypothetical protein